MINFTAWLITEISRKLCFTGYHIAYNYSDSAEVRYQWKYRFYVAASAETIVSSYLNLFFLYLIVRLVQYNSDGKAHDPILNRDVPLIVIL